MKSSNIMVRIDEETKVKAASLAKEKGLSLSSLIRLLIHEKLKGV